MKCVWLPVTSMDMDQTAAQLYSEQLKEASNVLVKPAVICYMYVEPGPPGNVSAISLGPRRVGVKWSRPANPFGPINDYRIFYSASKIVRREVANNENSIIVSAPKTEVNLTGLAPHTNYKITIAAINIRDGDNKILFGTRSNEVIVQTDEDGIVKNPDFICWPA